MNNLTGNRSLLSLANFKLIINSKDFSNTEFFAVSANIPSISVGEISTGYRNYAGFVSGEKLNYDPFNIRLLVDEDLEVYKEIFSWMRQNTSDKLPLKTVDMTLMLMTSHNNPSVWFRFINAFPTSLGQLDFNNQVQDVEYAAIDATFRYDYFVVGSAGDTFPCE